jgi:hypothetical protein
MWSNIGAKRRGTETIRIRNHSPEDRKSGAGRPHRMSRITVLDRVDEVIE